MAQMSHNVYAAEDKQLRRTSKRILSASNITPSHQNFDSVNTFSGIQWSFLFEFLPFSLTSPSPSLRHNHWNLSIQPNEALRYMNWTHLALLALHSTLPITRVHTPQHLHLFRYLLPSLCSRDRKNALLKLILTTFHLLSSFLLLWKIPAFSKMLMTS